MSIRNKIPTNLFKAFGSPSPRGALDELILADEKQAEYKKLTDMFGIEITNEREKDLVLSGNFTFKDKK